jgi:hypothetical protein
VNTTLPQDRKEALAAAYKGKVKGSRPWWFLRELEGNQKLIGDRIEQLRRWYKEDKNPTYRAQLAKEGKRLQNLYFAATGENYK